MRRFGSVSRWLADIGRWLQDDVIRRALGNIGYLASGSAVAAGLQFVTLILTARALGPAALGVLALIEAHVRLVDGLVRLEPWQAVIKYGADDLEHGETGRFRALIKFGVLVDLAAAALAALVAASAAPLVGYLSGWNAETIQLAGLYSLVMLARVSSTATGVLRLFDRFRLIAFQQALTSALRLALVGLAFLTGAGLDVFLMIAATVTVFSHGVILAAGWLELRAQGHADMVKARLGGVTRDHAGIWSFIWTLNASSLIRRSTREVDTLIVGGVLGPTAAGLFHVAKRLGDAILVLATPIQQVIYPDLARLWARGAIEPFRRTVVRVNWLTGMGLTLLIPVVAYQIDRIIVLTVGRQFLAGALLVVIQLVAAVTSLYGIANRAALQSMGRHTGLLRVVMLATGAFFLFFLATISTLGALSASLAHLVFNLVWLAGTLTVLKRGMEEGRRVTGASVAT